MITAALQVTRQHGGCISKQLRGFAELAVAGPTRYVETAPASVPMVQSLSQIQPSQVTTLDNGFRVITQSMPQCGNSQVGIYIDAGSRYETDANNGVAHFLEHLMFKGTKKRSLMDIEVEVENMGSHLNAYTSREMTSYYARCMGSNMSKSVDVLADILLNSTLDSNAIARERDVILREAKEVNGMPEEVCMDHLHATAFQHTPLGRTILGSTQNIQAISREDIETYIRTHYTAGRMVLAAAGNVDHEELVAAARSAFASLPADSTSASELVAAEPSHFTGSAVAVRDPDSPSTTLAIAFQGADWLSPDSVTLQVMQGMLGQWSKDAGAGHHARSRLATAIAQNGLADKFMSFNTSYHDTGLFGVYAQTSDPAQIEDLGWSMMQELTRLAYEVDADDVQLAKNSVKNAILNANSTSGGVCEELGRQTLTYGRHVPRDEMFARIDLVTPAVVQECAGRIIQDQDMAIAAVGELSLLPNYNWFRRRSYWNRY
eukprot:jgi/Ulvmu1/10144/UM006_0098.1